ncbi:hypothetical protein BJ170DRAFT_18292 [Xylariales sp. AK1849]|nr:hypothetical protein BJ170DRAFT_18292 [Xylariales sp. AK1849]
MTSSRKRKRKTSVNAIVSEGPSRKKVHDIPKEGKLTLSEQIKHDILGQYFSGVLTLRDYVLLKLPDSSRIRRKRIASIGGEGFAETVVTAVELSVGALLDLTLVGLSGKAKPISDNRWEQWSNFSQKGDDSYITLSDGLAGAAFSQSEIVDFVIWLLFSKSKASGTWPKHLLCDGFRRDPNFAGHQLPVGNQQPTIPGIFSLYPNPQVEALKQAPWPQLLKLIGKCGDRIMMDLLVDCAVFVSVKAGQGNYCQISGYPLSDTEALIPDSLQDKQSKDFERSPTEITFVRNRMLYARAALNARGLVQFGLRHILRPVNEP